jgi:ferritin
LKAKPEGLASYFTSRPRRTRARHEVCRIPARHGQPGRFQPSRAAARFTSAEAAAQLALDAEVRTTNQINDLLTLAIAEKNYAAQNFLQWFVNEQVEEIATATTNLDIIKKAGPNVLMVEAYLSHVNKD